ncbi:MAG: hypothetical protein GY854_10440 [Deltaproteobacteria bacterium]|nr:hypothetical protein [Deltaproteobacteria bacterium]
MLKDIRLFASTIVVFTIAALVIGDSGGTRTGIRPTEGPYEPNFSYLAKARTARRNQVENYLTKLKKVAGGIATDKKMLSAFNSIRKHDGVPPTQLDMQIDRHFVESYDVFYDILFVDTEGFVFHSIRRESDYHKNIFEGPLAKTQLAHTLKEAKELVFVDFERYTPSSESGAFFTVPVSSPEESAKHMGWFILQCSLNKLNSILTSRQGLGRTGETYLVNESRKMMSHSRFHPQQKSLRLDVETKAVDYAFSYGEGEQVIKDYRGVHVLSSYEAFEVHGATWVIVAEIDEDEVITEHFKKHKAYYLKEFASLAAGRTPKKKVKPLIRDFQRVDMNEFAGSHDDILSTKGVSTCTAVSVSLPGKFGYLAHIGPTDRVYGQINRGYNDRVSELLHHVQHFDVYPFEIGKLKMTIVATHDNSLGGIVDRFLDIGANLSQIELALNQDAKLANVSLFSKKGAVRIDWIDGKDNASTTFDSELTDLGSFVKELVLKSRNSV